MKDLNFEMIILDKGFILKILNIKISKLYISFAM